MKLQKTPLILLSIALLLGGGVYFYETVSAPKQEAAKTESQQLFSFKEDQVQALTVRTLQQTLTFERNAQAKSPDPKWLMKSPESAPASDASIAFLLNLMATGQSDRTLTVPIAQQAEFGFDQPLATIEVKLADQKTHRLVLGQPNFNRQFVYAQVDPPAQSGKELSVRLVSMDFENAVNRPLTEWKQQAIEKPKSDQPTPSP